jgi:hypothetical protein
MTAARPLAVGRPLVAVLCAACAPPALRVAALDWFATLDLRWGVLLDERTVLAGELGVVAGDRAEASSDSPPWRHPRVRAVAAFGDPRGAALARRDLEQGLPADAPRKVKEWERESGVFVLQPPLESEIQRQEQRARAAGVDRVH